MRLRILLKVVPDPIPEYSKGRYYGLRNAIAAMNDETEIYWRQALLEDWNQEFESRRSAVTYYLHQILFTIEHRTAQGGKSGCTAFNAFR